VDRRLGIALAVVTLVALALRTCGLGTQPLLGDDELAGVTARNFVEFGWPGPTMWHHPRLRDLLVYASSWALGTGPWGLKAWSVLLGTLAASATGYLVWILSASRLAAVMSAAIVATDPLHVEFSRQAINDVYVAFFPVAAIIALLVYAERRRPWQLVAAGLFLALGVASKWSAAFPVAAAVALTVPAAVASAGSRRAKGQELALDLAALVLLPAAVYLLTFWPWFGRGHDILEFIRFQRAMGFEAATHTGMAGTMVAGYTGYLVGAWRWFLQPVWWVDAVPPIASRSGIPEGGLFLPGVGNPVTWLATLPAAGWAAWRWFRARDRAAGILLVLWLAAYLPFALVPRPVFANSAVVIVPFWAALVGLASSRLWERARYLFAAWAAVAALVAVLLWVPATGRRFGPSDALVRTIVSPLALDPAYHPATSIYGVDADP
jgi:4-amino-4-deoxy-L-arabinose transferase-like glycosyltransferase